MSEASREKTFWVIACSSNVDSGPTFHLCYARELIVLLQ